MITLSDAVVDEIVARFEATDGGLLACNQIGADYGLLGFEVTKVVERRRTALAARPPQRPKTGDDVRREAVEAALPDVDVPSVGWTPPTPPTPPARRQSRTNLSADQLRANPLNIRDQLGDLRGLTQSLHDHGMLQPLVVTEHPDGYVIIDGHRRFAAGCAAGMTHFSATVRHHIDNATDQVILMLVANGQRVDLDAVERAQAFQSLVDAGLTQAAIARRCGVLESTVSDALTLLSLDDETLDQVKGGKISAYDALKVIRDVRRQTRKAAGAPQRGRKPNERQTLKVTAAEAAALSRLLYAYLGTVDADGFDAPTVIDAGGDPGLDTLRAVCKRVDRLRLDHSAYEDVLDATR